MPTGKMQPDTRIKLCVRDTCSPEEKDTHIVSSRTLKRGSPLGSYDFYVYPEAARKKRVLKKDGSHQQICSGYPCPTFGKVDAFVYPNETLGETYVHSSFHFGTTEFSRITAGRGNDSYLVESSISLDTNSCTSSVGSCSAMGSDDHNFHFGFSTQHDKNLDDCYSDDAESSCRLKYEEKGCSLSSNEEMGLEVHRSELHSYCSAVGALYTSGPLSWEDEEKLSNLRQTLHISDDEHLMVLRNLVSTNSRILIS